MTATTTIEIDFDVHKTIELNRSSFAETPNDVLRRLLGLTNAPAQATTTGKSYKYQNLELPHGTEARMTYNNVGYTARIDNGFWITEDGQRHKSPSGAASAVAVTKSGGRTKLDGWGYWLVKKPGSSDFIQLNDLWKAAQRRSV
ncbi:MAG: hypothetical protein ACK4NZ_09650 [Tsuneonella sp.]